MQIDELEQLLRLELSQRKEEGYDVVEIESRFLGTEQRNRSELEGIFKALSDIRPRPDFPYHEPSELYEIKAVRPREPRKSEFTISENELYNKILGGWLGRCAGCLLGKPVEGLRKEQIEEWLKMADAYPLANYFPSFHELPVDAPEWLKNRLSRIEATTRKMRRGVLLGEIARMARDDDIDYTILGLHILENYGPDFTTMDVGEAWLSLVPYLGVFTAERAAYRNLVNGILPPESATHVNPYREWIGAQIRADMWGYVTPGMPELGAKLAYRDAKLSHVKNGIYGEMFVSAMLSASFVTNSVEKIIEVGLSAIPEKSRLAEAVRDTIAWSKEYGNWRDAWLKMMEKYGHYHGVHTINNAAIVLIGLLYGDGNYERSITTSVMGGLDTDCNGATVGSIVGVMLGAEALPEKWVTPLNDRIESFIIGYNESQISDLAKRTCAVAKSFLES